MQPPAPLCPPASACFCEKHPNHPSCPPTVEIANIWIPAILIIVFVFYKINKNTKT